MINDNPLIKKLLTLNLPTNDYALFGSAQMFLHGIKELGHDIDIIARDEAWKKAQSLGVVEKTKLGDGYVVTLFDGEIEIFNDWVPDKWDINELIDTADLIENIRYVTLNNLIKWKKAMGRPKDVEHLKMIEDYLATGGK